MRRHIEPTKIRAALRRLRDDSGVGLATALSISFVVATLGGLWFTIGLHELDEVAFDASRTGAVNMADAGAREAMQRLATDAAFRSDAATADGADSGVTLGACDLTRVDATIDGSARQIGEYWYRASKVDPGNPSDRHYLIESWGWAPQHDRVQATVKKVVFEVELQPVGGGFNHALFAAEGGLIAGNRKEIYGDAYSGADLVISNFTRVFANDAGYPGDGNLEVYGDMYIGSGSNTDIAGSVSVNGYIDDRKGGTAYRGDVVMRHDNPASSLVGSYFKSATIDQTLFVAGPSTEVTGTVTAATEVYDATGLTPLPQISLPTFTWNPSDYSPAGQEWPTWAAFDTWYNANKGALSGAHYVRDPGAYTMDYGGAFLTGHFVLAFDGDLTIRKTPAGSSLAPAYIVWAGMQPTSDLTLAQSANSINGSVHHIGVTQGTFAATNQTTIYGALYGYQDASSNRLEIHFRPPPSEVVIGFEFDPALANRFLPEPGIWRETPPRVDGTGILKPGVGYYCNLP